MGVDLNGRQAQNWGPFQSSRTEKAISSGHQVVDSKQKVLFDAISQVVLAAATDQHGQVEDKKYRYVVDLILDRVRDALAKQTIALDKDTLASITENNKLLVQTTADVFSRLLQTAFKTLQVTVSEDQQDDFLDEIDEKLSDAVDDIVERISEKSNVGDSAKSGSSKDLFVAGIKSYFDKKFGNDTSKASKSSLGSDAKTSKLKFGLKASSFILMQKSLAALSKNQSLINTKLTQKFERTSEKISSLNQNTQGSLDRINNKISSPMKSVKGLFKKLATGLISIVTRGIKIAFRGISKVFGGIASGLKWTTKKLAGFLKSPLKIVGEFFKKVLLSPFGLYTIGYIAGWMYKKFIKPLWDWAKPIREAISKWFSGEISFKDTLKTISGHIWDGLKTSWNAVSQTWQNSIKPAIKDYLTQTFGYDKTLTFSKNLKIILSGLWVDIVHKWNNDINPELRKFFEVPDNQTWKDWFLNIKLFPVEFFGFKCVFTIGKVLGILGCYMLFQQAYKTVRMTKDILDILDILKGRKKGKLLTSIIKGLFTGIKFLFKGFLKSIKFLFTKVFKGKWILNILKGFFSPGGLVASTILVPLLTTIQTFRDQDRLKEYKSKSAEERAKMREEERNKPFNGILKYMEMYEHHLRYLEDLNDKKYGNARKEFDELEKKIVGNKEKISEVDLFNVLTSGKSEELFTNKIYLNKFFKLISNLSTTQLKNFQTSIENSSMKDRIPLADMISQLISKQIESNKGNQTQTRSVEEQKKINAIVAKFRNLSSFAKEKEKYEQLQKQLKESEKSDSDNILELMDQGKTSSSQTDKLKAEMQAFLLKYGLTEKDLKNGFSSAVLQTVDDNALLGIEFKTRDQLKKLAEQIANQRSSLGDLSPQFNELEKGIVESANKNSQKLDGIGQDIKTIQEKIIDGFQKLNDSKKHQEQQPTQEPLQQNIFIPSPYNPYQVDYGLGFDAK